MDNYQEIKIKINKMYRILCSVLALFFVIGTFVAYKVYVGNVCIEHELGRFTLLFIVGNWIIFSFLVFIETAIHSSECVSYAIALVLEMLLNIGLYIFLYIHVFTTKTVLNFIFSLIIFLFVSILQVVIVGLYYKFGVAQKQQIYDWSIYYQQHGFEDIEKYNNRVEQYNDINERIKLLGEKINKEYKKCDHEEPQEMPTAPVYDICNIHLLWCIDRQAYRSCYDLCMRCKKRREKMENVIEEKGKKLEKAERAALENIVENRKEIEDTFKQLKKETEAGKELRKSRKECIIKRLLNWLKK